MKTREDKFEALLKDKRLSNVIDYGDRILLRAKDGMNFKNGTNEFTGQLNQCCNAMLFLKIVPTPSQEDKQLLIK